MNRTPAQHRTNLPAFTVHREKHGGFTNYYEAERPIPFNVFIISANRMVKSSMRTQREYWADTLHRKYT